MKGRKSRKLTDDAEIGRQLAEWINKHPEDPDAKVIRGYVTRSKERGVISGEIRFEHYGQGRYSITYTNEPCARKAPQPAWFAVLLGKGTDTRLRPCKNCKQLWYSAGRFDGKFCSDICRVLF